MDPSERITSGGGLPISFSCKETLTQIRDHSHTPSFDYTPKSLTHPTQFESPVSCNRAFPPSTCRDVYALQQHPRLPYRIAGKNYNPKRRWWRRNAGYRSKNRQKLDSDLNVASVVVLSQNSSKRMSTNNKITIILTIQPPQLTTLQITK